VADAMIEAQQLMKELEQDPTGLNTKSKGFLELW